MIDFIAEALRNGAVAVVVERDDIDCDGAYVVVANARLALGKIAAYWRSLFTGTVIAITGSNGKTTVKEMTAAIMRRLGSGIATRGNLNNDIGVPLTLLKINPGDRFVVIEMGANHLGEIAYLTRLARPNVALVNNAAAAHLEGFGTVKDVVIAKSEIYSGLHADGIAIVNGDDPHAADFLQAAAPFKRLLFSMRHSTADFYADNLTLNYSATSGVRTLFHLHHRDETIVISLAQIGRHNVMNALAASAAARAAGATLTEIKAGLESFEVVPGRLNFKRTPSGITVIDDTYNANPASCGVAIEVLAALPGKRVLVLGDMGELGSEAEQMHREVGELALKSGVDAIYSLGELSAGASECYSTTVGHHFNDQNALIEVLLDEMDSGHFDNGYLLVKGSRFMRMERVVAALLSHPVLRGGARVTAPDVMPSEVG